MIAHDIFTCLCAGSVGFPRVRIPVTPYTWRSLDRDVYSEEYTAKLERGDGALTWPPAFMEAGSEWFSSAVPYTAPPAVIEVGSELYSDEILALHSCEPDWGMDDGLRLSPLQRLTGGSQGYRHLRYGLLVFRAGIPHRRALHFHRLAGEAFSRGDTYWGLRFSAWTIHFIEDIATPVHTKPFTWRYLLSKVFRLREVFFIAMNYHLNYERLVALLLEKGMARGNVGFGFSAHPAAACGPSELVSAILNAEPARDDDLLSSLLRRSRTARRLFAPIFEGCRKLWGDSMNRAAVDLSAEALGSEELSEMVGNNIRWLEDASSTVKGYIKEWVMPRLGFPGDGSRREDQ